MDKTLIREVAELTNDLNNLIPLGVIFVTQWPSLPAPGLPASNDTRWKWLDFPYEEMDGVSAIIKGLKLLTRRLYCRLTYRIVDQSNRIAIIRIYLIPANSLHDDMLNKYRDTYFKFKRSTMWLSKRCRVVMENLLKFTDFSSEAFTMHSSQDLSKYVSRNKVVILQWFSSDELQLNISSDEVNFHIERLRNSSSVHIYVPRMEPQSTLQTRLNKLYANLRSPIVDQTLIKSDEEFARIKDIIQNDEIDGFRSQLYNFQKRSILKMVEKESVQREELMPSITQFSRGFFDVKNLQAIVRPPTYRPPRGGILAENMGLGKTCICLALICISKLQASRNPTPHIHTRSVSKVHSLFDTCVEFITQNSIPWRTYYDDFAPHIIKRLETTVGYFEKKETKCRNKKTRSNSSSGDIVQSKKYYLSYTTLVVLPDNLFHQWRIEIFKHVEKNYLNVFEIQTLKDADILKSIDIEKLVNYDVLLIANSVFSKQFEIADSLLKQVYWKRLIIDEGHSVSSKTSRCVLLTKDLMYERMWVISGTPTSGLTNLHMENQTENISGKEYTIQKSFDPRQDLVKLGLMVANFFKIEPWASNKKLWNDSIVKPFKNFGFNIEFQLSSLLEQLIIRHDIKDVESDIQLPKLHHRPVFLKPSFFDKLSINLFISVLATNAITSQRRGIDYVFDPTNKSDLKRLVTNLQKGTFYWTGFSINDVENLLNICVYSLRENKDIYSIEDRKSLKKAIYISKLALSNLRWRSISTIHEMGYFVKGLPKTINDNYSLLDYGNNIFMFGYPHLIAIQKFYYKNRILNSNEELRARVMETSPEFWKGYWSNIKGSKNKKENGNGSLSNKEEYKEFELTDVKMINQVPTWESTFDAKTEETLLYKKELQNPKCIVTLKYKCPCNSSTECEEAVSTKMLRSEIVGTLSSKLNYLTMRLLENESQGLKSIVFYEFENSAYYLTEFLDLLGINYIMYAPHIKLSERSNNLAQFDRWDPLRNEGEGIALVMDLKLASHGLTIIAATQVFFINPVWNQSVEAQAIKRSHRIGQTKEVFVETIILENTLEEQMYNMRGEVKDSDKIEVVDHQGIKEYILQFPFLKMYADNSYDEEYCKLIVPTAISDVPTDHVENVVNKIRMNSAQSTFDNVKNQRTWRLPLFTMKNMEKLSSFNSKVKKRRFDNIDELEYEESERTTQLEEEDIKLIMEKLRVKRRKQSVKFNI